MVKRFMICKGDQTTHGGTVLEGAELFRVEGVPVSHVGHMVSCSQCKGTFPIIDGEVRANIMGMNIALEAMKTACGAALISSQTLSSVDDDNWVPNSHLNVNLARKSIKNEPEILSAKDVPANHFASINPVYIETEKDENSTKDVEAWLITTIIALNKIFLDRIIPAPIPIRDHSALYINIKDEEEMPFLFDPAGSFLLEIRGSSNFLTENDANIDNYVKFHMKDSKVTLDKVTLTKKQAKNIIKKAIEYAFVPGMECATSVSNILHEDYGTPVRDGITRPSLLQKDVLKIENTK